MKSYLGLTSCLCTWIFRIQ
jgi:hypothetical protein